MSDHTLVFQCPPHFSLRDTFTCGQCFRFAEYGGRWRGVVGGQAVSVYIEDGRLCVGGDVPLDETAFFDYFDLAADYEEYKERLSAAHPFLRLACAHAPGIRILRQDAWEALISFIVSQNNNIPRITGIIERLCALFGQPRGDSFAFPPPQALAGLEAEALAPIRAGFRASYLLDAARLVSGGEVDLGRVRTAPLAEAREELRRIRGVGVKVSECALLYGFHRLSAFPVDVWMARAMAQFLPERLPGEVSDIAGVAQQYIFHYARTMGKD